MDKRFLSRTEVAEMFGRSHMTLYRWERAGLLQPIKIMGKPLYPAEQVEALARHGDGKVKTA